MKIGMNLLLWLLHMEESDASLMKQLKEIGYDGVEIPLNMGDAAHYKKIRGILDSEGLECTTVTALSPEKCIISPEKSHRQAGLDHIKWAVDMSVELGSPLICGPFYAAHKNFVGRGPIEEEYQRCAEQLKVASEYAASAGVKLSMEFLNRFEIYLLNTVEQCLHLIDLVGHPNLGIHYDTHHANIEESDSKAAIRLGGKNITHVHFSENHRGTLGAGQIDFKGQYEVIQSLGYDDWVTVEIFGTKMQAFVEAANVHRQVFDDEIQAATDSFKLLKSFVK